MNDIEEFWRKNNKLILTITLILIIIIFSIVFYNYKINDYSITLVQFLTGIGGLITLGGLFLNVYYLDKRDKKSQEQIKLTNEQIRNQEKTRKDQQFLDAIKLIEETKDINSKIAYLKILENLANEDIDYRQKILDYLGVHTEKLKKIIENLKFGENFKLEIGKEFVNQIGFKNYKIYWHENFGIKLNINGNEVEEKYEDDIIKIEQQIQSYYYPPHSDPNFDEPIPYEIPTIIIFIDSKIKNNQSQIKQNFYELINEEKKFEFECLKLCYKLINQHSKIKKELNISNIFIPFLTIEHIETNLILYSNYPENLFGLTYMPLEKKETKIQPNYVPNYANIQNVNRVYFERNYGKNSSLLNIKEIFNLSNKINSIHFEKINFSLNNFIQFNREYFFINCSFYQTNFIIKNKNELKDIEKNKWFSELTFNECYFGANCKFENFIFQELYFDNCEISKEYPIQGLETVQILSNNKEKLNEMIKRFKDLISKNSEIGIPQFPNAKWVEKELKKFKKGNFIK